MGRISQLTVMALRLSSPVVGSVCMCGCCMSVCVYCMSLDVVEHNQLSLRKHHGIHRILLISDMASTSKQNSEIFSQSLLLWLPLVPHFPGFLCDLDGVCFSSVLLKSISTVKTEK